MGKLAWAGVGVGVLVVGGFLWARAGMAEETAAPEPKKGGGIPGLPDIDFTDFMSRALGDERVQSNVRDFASQGGAAVAAFGKGIAGALGSAS